MVGLTEASLSKLKHPYNSTLFYRGGQANRVVIFATPSPLILLEEFVIYITKKSAYADFWFLVGDEGLEPPTSSLSPREKMICQSVLAGGR